jgi:protein tyrosine/serine phosphatase
MRSFVRMALVAVIVLVIFVLPVIHFRAVYAHGKRFREVTPGLVFRSGQLTGDGFRDFLHRFGIRLVINLQDDFPDPDITNTYLDRGTIKESDLCRELGVRFITISPDTISRRHGPDERPKAIDEFLALMDDPDTYPVLLHCKAGLHRTGCMVAIYRMEYEGWDKAKAVREMKENGFGEWACTEFNDYVTQYVLEYRRGVRKGIEVRGHRTEDRRQKTEDTEQQTVKSD